MELSCGSRGVISSASRSGLVTCGEEGAVEDGGLDLKDVGDGDGLGDDKPSVKSGEFKAVASPDGGAWRGVGGIDAFCSGPVPTAASDTCGSLFF